MEREREEKWKKIEALQVELIRGSGDLVPSTSISEPNPGEGQTSGGEGSNLRDDLTLKDQGEGANKNQVTTETDPTNISESDT